MADMTPEQKSGGPKDKTASFGEAPPRRGFDPGDERFPPPPPPPPPPPARPLERPLPSPIRLVYGDMAGAFFLCWIPVLLAFFLPWSDWLPGNLFGSTTFTHVMVALVIAIPPWIVLILHLVRGRLWDGILDMLLWAIWECMIMITLCYLYQARAEEVIWRASEYWGDMRQWLTTGVGSEGDPRLWLPIHARNLIIIVVMGFLFGLPALLLGVLQLNFMNFYVAQCLLASDNALATLPIAWHFWSMIRVIGYIILASSMFQLLLKLLRAPARWGSFWGGITVGLILVILDAVLKWQFAEQVRQTLNWLCDF